MAGVGPALLVTTLPHRHCTRRIELDRRRVAAQRSVRRDLLKTGRGGDLHVGDRRKLRVNPGGEGGEGFADGIDGVGDEVPLLVPGRSGADDLPEERLQAGP